MDAWGDHTGMAMARLVSIAVEMVTTGEIAAGLHAASSKPELVDRLLDKVHHLAQHLTLMNRIG